MSSSTFNKLETVVSGRLIPEIISYFPPMGKENASYDECMNPEKCALKILFKTFCLKYASHKD